MKNLLSLTLFLSFFVILSGGCASSPSVAQSERQPKVEPNANTPSNLHSTGNSNLTNTSDTQNAEEGEIINCTPQKLYRGETVEIIFAQQHGGKMAVYREPRESFFFLNSNEDGSSPILTEAEIEKSAKLELNTETTRKINYAKADSSGSYTKIDRVFNKTGWYRIIVGREPLDVEFESIPVTGMCRIYYVNKKRPKQKSKS